MFELYIIFLENVNMVNISIQTIRADVQVSLDFEMFRQCYKVQIFSISTHKKSGHLTPFGNFFLK